MPEDPTRPGYWIPNLKDGVVLDEDGNSIDGAAPAAPPAQVINEPVEPDDDEGDDEV